jgi:hypothetical protein
MPAGGWEVSVTEPTRLHPARKYEPFVSVGVMAGFLNLNPVRRIRRVEETRNAWSAATLLQPAPLCFAGSNNLLPVPIL